LSSAAPALAAGSALGLFGITSAYLQQRGLRLYDEATDLVLADTGADGREFRLTPPAARAWRAMQSAAAGDGITLVLESAYRSVARQVEILQAKLAAGQALADALLLVAPPGCSEHHTGCAVDIGTPGSVALREDFETTTAFDWLRANAGRHGFVMSYPRGNVQGYSYEPWHWCFQGLPAD
jgi:D-alanyl-D-alanine carboxypeptidase